MIVYDAGALVAAERNERPMWALHEATLRRGLSPLVPTTVLAQVWRGGPQASLNSAVISQHPGSGSTSEVIMQTSCRRSRWLRVLAGAVCIDDVDVLRALESPRLHVAWRTRHPDEGNDR